ncbi:hypothetical protein A2U01_0036148, partial [Trifolium medium]|nr:hypothetical protein [Trifolium medium]
ITEIGADKKFFSAFSPFHLNHFNDKASVKPSFGPVNCGGNFCGSGNCEGCWSHSRGC